MNLSYFPYLQGEKKHGLVMFKKTRYHYTKSKNGLKDDIEFVTEFPCLLGHPVDFLMINICRR